MRNIILIIFFCSYLIATCPTDSSYGGFDLPLSFIKFDEYGFLGDSNILKIFDLRNPDYPSLISSIQLPSHIVNLNLINEYLYASVKNNGLYIIDIKNPYKPKIVNSLQFKCSYMCPISAFGNYAYLCYDEGSYILDISKRSEPKILNKFTNYTCLKSFIDGNYLYYNSGLIYSISDPKSPELISISSECSGPDLHIQGNYAYFAGRFRELIICDIQDKKNPKKISQYGTPGDYGPIFDLIEFKDEIAYITGNTDIVIIDTFDKFNPFQIGEANSFGNNDIHISGDRLYACSYDNTLKIFNIRDCKHENLYPQASFGYEPINPKVGEKVYFKDTSYPFATSWEWDFGDGQKSLVRNPANVYLKEGEYEVKFTAKNPAGQTTISKKIYVGEGSPLPPFDEGGEYKYLIPAVAHTPGANGTFWKSDLMIISPQCINWGSDVSINIYFIKEGEGNCNYEGVNIKIENEGVSQTPDKCEVKLDDIVYKLFGEERRGGLWIASNNPLIITSRTYNTGGGKGSYGQYIPAIEKDKLNKNQNQVFLPNIIFNEDYRANIGFINGESEEKVIVFEWFEIGSDLPLSVKLPPCSWNQYSLKNLLGNYFSYFPYFEGYLKTYVIGTDGTFMYSSNVDNKTGDAIFVPEALAPLSLQERK